MARDCTPYQNVQTVFIPFFLCWSLALAFWVYNTFVRNRASANNLHKGLTWLPVVECIYTFLCIFYYAACPWETFGSQLVAAALLMVVILKEPLNLLCLLLVSKGWCITRDSLSYSENRIIVVTVLLLYASVVFELFAPNNSTAVYWMIPIILSYIVMLVNAGMSMWTNLRILKSQLLAMAQLNIDALSTPAYAKYLMFQRLAVATAVYVAMELTIHISTSVTRSPAYVFLLCHQLMELSVATFIGVQFRARPLNSVFHQMQEFGLQLAEQLLPSVTTISINRLELSAPGMVEWSDKMEAPPEQGGARGNTDEERQQPMSFIVVNPGGDADDAEPGACVQTAVCSELAAQLSAASALSEPSGASRAGAGADDDDESAEPALLSAAAAAAATRPRARAGGSASGAGNSAAAGDDGSQMPSLELMPTPPPTADSSGRRGGAGSSGSVATTSTADPLPPRAAKSTRTGSKVARSREDQEGDEAAEAAAADEGPAAAGKRPASMSDSSA